MRHILSTLLVMALVAASGLVFAPRSAEATFAVVDCDTLNDSLWDGLYLESGFPWSGPLQLNAGDVITINVEEPPNLTFTPFLQDSKALLRTAETNLLYLELLNTVVATATYSYVTNSASLTYVVPNDINVGGGTNNIAWYLDVNTGPSFEWSISCTPAGEPGTGDEEPGMAVPGCDVLINLPSSAVVGSFVSDADLYWTPGSLTDPVLTIGAGNTAWVLGVDASGEYYKILWGCQFVWVPVGTMGPNFDEVWNGTPLPAGVVS